MSFQSLNESTQKYQTIQRNTEQISPCGNGTIFKLIKNHKFFKLSNSMPNFQNEEQMKEYQKILGSGGFANVYRSFDRKKKMAFAVKVHQNISEAEIQSIANEYIIQTLLNKKFQDYFLRLIDNVFIVQGNQNTYSTLAGMELGITSLDKYLEERQLGIEEFQCLYHEILDSILKMHSLHIAHGDIKPQNILYVQRKKWVLGDFGCAKIYQNKKEVHKIAGTKSYLPKHIRNKIQQFFQDIEMEMDLFQNDIYAFTLTMLQAYLKNIQIAELQNMIDQSNWQHIQHDSLQYLFQIYQKPCSYIKQHILKNYQHVEINQDFVKQQIKKLDGLKYNVKSEKIIEQQDYLSLLYYNSQIQYPLSEHGLQQLVIDKMSQCDGLKFFFQNDQKIYQSIMKNPFQLVDEDKNQKIFQINQKTEKWQFLMIMLYFMKKGNINQQILSCLEFQKFTEQQQFEIKLTLIDRFFLIGQEEIASDIIQELQNNSCIITEAQSFNLKVYQLFFNKNWLQQACSVVKNIPLFYFDCKYLKYIYHMIYYFDWVYLLKELPCQAFKEKQSEEEKKQGKILNQYEQQCEFFGILGCPINQIINQLKARGADSYGIFSIFYDLIANSQYNNNNNNHKLIKDLHLQLINFIEQNKQLQHYFWLILLNYSMYCYNQQNYEESLQYQLRALDQVDNDDQENKLIINIQIYYSLLQQFKYIRAQKLLTELVDNIYQHSKGEFREILVQKLIGGALIILFQLNYNELQQCLQTIRSTLYIEMGIQNQNRINSLQWEPLVKFQNLQQLINYFNFELANQTLNSKRDNCRLFKAMQDIIAMSIQQSKQSVSNNFQEKYELDKLDYTDFLNIDYEISKLLYTNQTNVIDRQKSDKMILQLKYFM